MEMREPLDTSEKPMSSQIGTRTVLFSVEVANETTAPIMAVETRCIDTKVVAAHATEMLDGPVAQATTRYSLRRNSCCVFFMYVALRHA